VWILSALLAGCVRSSRADVVTVEPGNASVVVEGSTSTGEALADEVAMQGLVTPTLPPLPVAGLGSPGATLRGRLVWHHRDDGQPFGLHTELVSELRFTELSSVTGDDDPDSTAYRVDGQLSHVTVGTGCTVEDGDCRVVALQDADLVGVAVWSGSALSIELQWRTFGPDREAGRPSARVAIDLREFGYLGVAEAMEAAGAVGSTVVVPFASMGRRDFSWVRGSLQSNGELVVELG
jgi:hypothetical protein